jgi:hypothetical protein
MSKGRSRFPEGMTERKAKARAEAKAKAEAKAEATAETTAETTATANTGSLHYASQRQKRDASVEMTGG